MPADLERPHDGDITQLLASWRAGNPGAVDALFPLVYRELRSMARRQLGQNASQATLGATALVHEAYLKLVDHTQANVQDRHHFFAVAARAMRQILVDYVRNRRARKRGGGHVGPLDTENIPVDAQVFELLAIDRALTRLETLDERLGRLVELRVFGGLSVEESADALGISERTVKRDWQKARAFLFHELSPTPLRHRSEREDARRSPPSNGLASHRSWTRRSISSRTLGVRCSRASAPRHRTSLAIWKRCSTRIRAPATSSSASCRRNRSNFLSDAADRDAAPDALPDRIGAWRVVREIGRGGMGVVYLAERAEGDFEQLVALKLIKRGLDSDDVLSRFRRERQILARLQHPAIASLVDGGLTADGRPYVAMEVVEGKRRTPMPQARRSTNGSA